MYKILNNRNLNENYQLNDEILAYGRIMSVRDMRKVIFFDIYDIDCVVQAMIIKSDFNDLKLSKGDIVEVTGIVNKTNSEDLAVVCSDIKVLKKSEILIPDTWIKDDLAIKHIENESLYILANHKKVAEWYSIVPRIERNIRQYLSSIHFTEIKTPILQRVASGAMARPFKTYHNYLDKQIELRIAPELMLKRLLISGYTKIYEIGQCFRNEGSSPAHLQEFTMLELYSATTSDTIAEYKAWQKFCIQLLAKAVENLENGQLYDRILNMPITTYSDLLQKYIGHTLEDVWKNADLLNKLCVKYDVNTNDYPTKEDQIERLYKVHARSKLINPIMVIDYPTMPLAKSNGIYSYQFQVIIDTHEVLKACVEEDDYKVQQEKFADQDSKKDILQGEVAQSDNDYIECMKLGMPPSCGVGIGLNRLAQIVLKALGENINIKDTVILPM